MKKQNNNTYKGQTELVLSGLFLLSSFGGMVLDLAVLPFVLIALSGFLGIVGSVKVIRNRLIILGWLQIRFDGWMARLLGTLYLIFSIFVTYAGVYMLYIELK